MHMVEQYEPKGRMLYFTMTSRAISQATSIVLIFSYAFRPPPRTLSLQTYHTLTLVSRDSLALLTVHMERIIMEKMSKLQDTTRIQVCY